MNRHSIGNKTQAGTPTMEEMGKEQASWRNGKLFVNVEGPLPLMNDHRVGTEITE